MTDNRNILVLAFLALMLGLSSCSDNSDPQRQTGSVSLSFRTVSDDHLGLKSTLSDGYSYAWQEGDDIGLFVDNAYKPTTNAVATAFVIDGDTQFKARINEFFAGDMLYAYYPYAVGAERDGYKVRMSISAAQNQVNVGELNGVNFPLVARPYTFRYDPFANEVPTLYFKHLAAYLEFDIYAEEQEYVGEKVALVQLNADSDIVGAFQFDFSQDFEDPSYSIMAGNSSSVTVNLTNPSAVSAETGVNKIYMDVAPGEYGTLSVFVHTDWGIYEYQIPEEAGTFTRAKVHRFSLGLRASNVIYRRTMEDYTDKYIGAQQSTTYGVYFNLENASNYGASEAIASEVRKETDLVLFYSIQDDNMCFAAPACSDLSNFSSQGIIDCNNWDLAEKNKTKIHLLDGFIDDQYEALTLDQIESLTQGWENQDRSDLHRQNNLQPGNYYGFKTVRMTDDFQVSEVVNLGVIKVVEVVAGVDGYVKFDYKISRNQ